ncbi:MAG TPA: hypothetical protein VKR79_09595 [Gaiellaceae bacterium]|nr:hypothetical protein [Gaiellaceae bacterium]
MIHVATVHWKTDKWIDLQLAAFERFITEPYLTYAFLNDISPDCRKRFSYTSEEPIESHAIKLGVLGDIACFHAASDDDGLLFIDGDAFPVAPLSPLLDKLREFKLAAAQRYENAGDVHPHPSFCLTTVGFWQEIGGNWHKGPTGGNWDGKEYEDVGGGLRRILEERNVDWLPLRRLNRVNPHPVLFGVYGDADGPIVYHHGAGFRAGITLGWKLAAQQEARATIRGRLLGSLPYRRPFRRLRRRFDPYLRIQEEMRKTKARMSAEWFDRLSDDHESWRALI